MEIVYLEAVLMDNGELISMGISLGWKNNFGKAIHNKAEVEDRKMEEAKNCEECSFSPCHVHA